MARWIELHRDDREHTPVVVNVDWIVWFEQREKYTCVALGYGSVRGNNGSISTAYDFISVQESDNEIKDKLNIL